VKHSRALAEILGIQQFQAAVHALVGVRRRLGRLIGFRGWSGHQAWLVPQPQQEPSPPQGGLLLPWLPPATAREGSA